MICLFIFVRSKKKKIIAVEYHTALRQVVSHLMC